MPIFESIGEIIVHIIIEPIINIILVVPGAFFRFLISRLWLSKKSLGDFFKDDVALNGVVGLVGLVCIGLLIASV